MKIPHKFEMLGWTIKVQRKSDSYFETNCNYGCWVAADQTITIRNDITEQAALVTFWHEFYHAALEALGEPRLSADEKLVDGLAGLTCQMFKSSK